MFVAKSDAPEDLPRLLADRGQPETALVNLATNARDAMPDGGTITLSAAHETVLDPITHPAMAPVGRYIRLTVRDFRNRNGCCYAGACCRSLFSLPSPRAGAPAWASRWSAALHGSRTAHAYRQRVGTREPLFRYGCRKPLCRCRVKFKPLHCQDGDPTLPGHLLLVDDDEMVRSVLVPQLIEAGYAVTVAQMARKRCLC